MKKLVSVISIAMVLMIAGCDPASQYPVSFKVNGATWYASSAPAAFGGGKILINANSITQGQNPISFSISQYAIIDTFLLDSINNGFLYGATPSSGYYAKMQSPATIIIKEYNPTDKKIVADFYGWIYNMANTDSVLITDGKFDLHYQ